MANKTLVAADATPVVWANLADYAGDGGTRTRQLNLTSLDSGFARQGEKHDLDNGLVLNRYSHRYKVTMRIEFAADAGPMEGTSVDLYWAASLNASEDTANPGGVDGDDGPYTGTVGSSLEESLEQLQFLGSLLVTDDDEGTTQQSSFIVGLPTQFGIPVVVNSTNGIFNDNAIEMSITFTPIEWEIQ